MYKVGDELALETRFSGWKIEKIHSISKTGRITLSSGITLNKDLALRGRGDCSNYPYSAVPVTDEIRTKIHRKKNIERIRLVNFNLFDNEQLERIITIIGELK